MTYIQAVVKSRIIGVDNRATDSVLEKERKSILSSMPIEVNTWYTTLINCLIAVVAFCGNAMVICIILRKSSEPRFLAYHVFLLNLGITDIITSLMLIFSPYIFLPPLPSDEISREIYCKMIWNARMLFLFCYVSLYTCLALSIERWFAVVKPMFYNTIRAQHAVKTVLVVWVWGIAISIKSTLKVKYDKVKNQCFFPSKTVAGRDMLWLDVTLQSVIPIALMVIIYGHIVYSLKRLPSSSHIRTRALKRVTAVSLMASTALIIGWMPGRIYSILLRYGLISSTDSFFYEHCFAMLVFSNSCVNPFLYGAYSPQFRKEYKLLLTSAKCIWKKNDEMVT